MTGDFDCTCCKLLSVRASVLVTYEVAVDVFFLHGSQMTPFAATVAANRGSWDTGGPALLFEDHWLVSLAGAPAPRVAAHIAKELPKAVEALMPCPTTELSREAWLLGLSLSEEGGIIWRHPGLRA